MLLQMTRCHFFMIEWYSIVCILHSLHPFVSWWALSLFLFLSAWEWYWNQHRDKKTSVEQTAVGYLEDMIVLRHLRDCHVAFQNNPTHLYLQVPSYPPPIPLLLSSFGRQSFSPEGSSSFWSWVTIGWGCCAWCSSVCSPLSVFLWNPICCPF